MATNLTETTFPSTYKDDFTDSAGFHKILFNSGKALQARELTQLQTILQNQIQRFGDNVFKEGAVVKPGGANLNSQYEFIKLNTTVNTLPTDISSLVGTSFTGQTSGVIVKVLEVVAATGSDPDTLYVQYTNTSSGTAGPSTIRMTPGEDINNGSVTLTVQTVNTAANPAVGVGVLATLASGIYYVRGHFVFTEDQSKIISKYNDTVTTNIGFKAVEDIVSSIDDESLFDNQGAVPNLTAPGADRYRIKLTIVEESDVDSDENFIHIATVKEGAIYNAVTNNNAYNIPNEVIAKRIFENSGDYIVKPYTVDFSLDSASTHLLLNVSAGTAVVDGFRADRSFPTTIRVQKPTQTITLNNDVIGVNYGNSVIVSPETDSATHGLPNINVYEKLTLKDGLDFTGNDLGTVRVKAINEDGANLRYHLFDLQLNSGSAFRNVKSIGTSTSSYFRPTLESSKAVLKEAQNNTSLFKLTRNRPRALTDISFAVQRRFTATSNVSGEASINLTASGEKFTNTGDWIIAKEDSDVFTGASISGGGSTSSTITGLPPSSSLEIFAYVEKTEASVKQKVLANKSITISVDSDGNGRRIVPLATADIFELDEVVKENDSSVSYIDRFVLDNGQRDNHYGLGRLILKSGQSAPASNVHVKFKHFTHALNGDFFAVNSYGGQVDYNRIPKYRFSNGVTINLRDYADFRPVMDSGGEFTGSAARVIEQPQNGTLVGADIEYYLDRASKLVVDREGIIRLINGIPSFYPAMPEKPDQTLALYDFVLRGNTDDDSDVMVSKIEHKRFTMKDIAQLEKRLANLEEVASLNLLEVDTKHLQVLDSAGNNRAKSGFIVDNFSDHSKSFTSSGYRASIDPLQKELRPGFKEDNIRLIYDSASSTNTIRKGDNVYIAYDETPYINQNLASKSIKLNPFAVVIYDGIITLSPSSDEWRDVDRRQDKVIQGGTRLSTVNAYNWNNWSWSWGGVSLENLQVGSSTNVQSGVVNRVVSEETVLDLVEDRVLQTAFLPFMRARKVFFKVQGLRPNTRVFPFLDGNNISDFTRSETFQFYSDTNTDFGNTLKNTTAHPDGSTNLTTDVNGDVSGSFIVPNNSSLKIRVGTREFKIMDISVDNEKNAGCVAKAPYTATGFLDTKEATYSSTRQLNITGVNVQNRATYQGGDGGNPDDGKVTNTVTTTGSWVTGPEPMSYSSIHDYSDFSGGNSQAGNNDPESTVGDDPSNEGDAGVGADADTDGALCLLEDMMVMLNGRISEVTNVKVGDTVSYGTVIEVMHKHIRNGYYIINDELKITNDHPVLVNGSWKRTEDVIIGDYINNVKVESIKYIEKIVPTVYIGVDTMSYDVYCGKNIYTVHGHYKEKMQKAS